MKSNSEAIALFNEMAKLNKYNSDNFYFSSGRPVKIDPKIIVEDIDSKLELKKNDLLLDVGCGTGVITLPISKKVNKIFALDGGFNVIEQLKKNIINNKISNINTINIPFDKNNFEDNFFDKVLMYAVIHYLDGDKYVKNCIEELIRICKPGGKILIAEIPEKNAIENLRNGLLTNKEKQIINNFEKNRNEYDQFMKQFDVNKYQFNYLEMEQDKLKEICKDFGCEAQILKQDIRQPFSLTRRDLLIKLPS
tara:strand:- start:35 stop:787 length:753 start_codon:yes stop_codon:yes gene_type:complete